VGDGRLAEPWEIVSAAASLLGPRDLAGRKVLVTAGPTREHLDPVRFVSNPSTGTMGYAIAAAARMRGAEVVLVSGPVALEPPSGVRVVQVTSAAEMATAVGDHLDGCDLVVMSAAVSDYRADSIAPHKVKKRLGPETITFQRTEDILATLGRRFTGKRRRPLLVGFAAETQNLVTNARRKLEGKGADFIVANDVGPGGAFGSRDNEVLVVSSDGETRLDRASKERIASQLLDLFVPRLPKSR
jgi:phosphopantothenoylcysteine decarboxylase / phosphopantothenate---cysteine ligase